MSRIKALGLALVAVFAMSIVSVASASAHVFKASKTGTLKGHALTNQKFKTNGGTVECTTAASSGTVTSLETKEQLVKVKYSGCTAFGTAAEVSEAEYAFNAENTVAVKNTITIKATAFGCSVTVGPTGNQTLATITYKNSAGKIVEETNVTGITYTSTGGLCGTSGTNGTDTGNNEIELEGGTIEWI